MDFVGPHCFRSAHFEEAEKPLCHMGYGHSAGLVKESNLGSRLDPEGIILLSLTRYC